MEQNDTDVLYHHGIKGQRWGFRRYQNKDGSLTPAGKKRADKLKQQYLEVTGKKLVGRAASSKGKTSSKNDNNSNKEKSINEMTNEELREKTNRLRLENDYSREISNYQTLHPKKVSLGQKFITHLGKNVIAPAATEAGKNFVRNYMDKVGNEALGINTKDVSKDLAKAAQDYENRQKIDKGQKYFKEGKYKDK